jgi:ribosome maturation factor RimP
MISDVRNNMARLAENIAKRSGLEVVDTEVYPYKNQYSVKVFIAKHEGVTIKDCSYFSRNLDVMIQAEGLLKDSHYTLEISSPGLDRPLKNLRDFERNLNRLIKVTYRDAEAKILIFRGHLKKINHENLEIVNSKDLLNIPIRKIIKANLEVEL